MKKLLIVIVVLVFSCSTSAFADADFGINLDWNKFRGSDEGDWGIGGRFDVGSGLRFIGSFDYYFVDADEEEFDLKFWEANGNLAYRFPTEVVHPYVGGGLGVARSTFEGGIDEVFEDSQTELGFNALGGVVIGDGAVKPFVEFRGTWYGGDESFDDRFIFSAGILF